MPRIWNLTDRVGLGPPERFRLGGQPLVPGDSLVLPGMPPHLERLLESGRLVVGDSSPAAVPVRRQAVAAPAAVRTRAEVRADLSKLSEAELDRMAVTNGVSGNSRSSKEARLAAVLVRGSGRASAGGD